MKKTHFLLLAILLVSFCLNSCEQPADTNTGIWDKVVNATNYTLDVSNGQLNMSMTAAPISGLLSLTQTGPFTGDFSMTLTFSGFATDDQGTYFALASSGFAASIGKMPGNNTTQVSCRTNSGTYKIANAAGASGTFTISRTGSDVTCSYDVGGSTADVRETGYTGALGVVLKMNNNYPSQAATGTITVKCDDFAVTGTGVTADDFSTNKIK
jgi:hypothetical protein